ncbi:hypothetical protein L1887_39085 [Cichorium endivia]|nr:hypothetical protein L1887_39085 [Cichorium endivia]
MLSFTRIKLWKLEYTKDPLASHVNRSYFFWLVGSCWPIWFCDSRYLVFNAFSNHFPYKDLKTWISSKFLGR